MATLYSFITLILLSSSLLANIPKQNQTIKKTSIQKKSVLPQKIKKWLEKQSLEHIDASHQCLKSYRGKKLDPNDDSWKSKINSCLKKEDFAAWKNEIKAELKNPNFFDNVLFVIKKAEEETEKSIFDGDINHKKVNHCYNLLKKLVPRLSTPTSRLSEEWVSEVKKETALQQVAQRAIAETKYSFPSNSQLKLLREHQDILQIAPQIVAASHYEWNNGTTYKLSSSSIFENNHLLALPVCPDLNDRLFTLYHEFGHIIHNDSAITQKFSTKIIDPEDYINQPQFKADFERIMNYRKKGIEAFTKSHPLGSYIIQTLKKYNYPVNFVQTPPAPILRALRLQEMRADLYAIENLFEQNLLDPILAIIEEWGSSDYVLAHNQDPHPSHFERSLYMTGFLVNEGIDINKAFKKFNTNGTCIVETEDMCTNGCFYKSEGALDLYSALQSHMST